jgi:hypothetical protein
MSEDRSYQETVEAWDRVARSPDGLVIYRHLQRILMGLAISEGALPMNEGRRSLAADLMAFMADGIRDYDRACVTYTIVAKPNAGGGSRTDVRREWLASQPWTPADPGTSTSTGSGGTGNGGAKT